MDFVINTWRTDDFDLRITDENDGNISKSSINNNHSKKVRNSIHAVHKMKISIGITTTITSTTTTTINTYS